MASSADPDDSYNKNIKIVENIKTRLAAISTNKYEEYEKMAILNEILAEISNWAATLDEYQQPTTFDFKNLIDKYLGGITPEDSAVYFTKNKPWADPATTPGSEDPDTGDTEFLEFFENNLSQLSNFEDFLEVLQSTLFV